MDTAMLTLFKSVSGGADWAEVAQLLEGCAPGYMYVFIAFVFFYLFSVTNIVTAIFVNYAVQATSLDMDILKKRVNEEQEFVEQMESLFYAADDDGDGKMSFQ